MDTSRRHFVRFLGLGVAGASLGSVTSAWADRLRILGGGGGPESAERWAPGGQVSSTFQRFLAGVRTGDVKSHGPLRVVWLSGPPSPGLPVATLEEARGQGDLLIVEREQATVPELIVENRGKLFVLLLAGEILLGGKQNRVLTEDILLPPRSGPRPIGVYCVEQGRWAGRSKDFEAKGSFAAPGLRSRLMEKADQGRVWAEVDRYARSAAAPSATRSYQAIYEQPEVKAHLEEAERTLRHGAAAGALGAAVFVGRALAGIDLFADPGLFARQWPKLLRAQAVDAYRQPAETGADEAGLRARVERLLRAAASAEGNLRTNAGVGQLFEGRVEDYRSAALTFEGRVVHAALL